MQRKCFIKYNAISFSIDDKYMNKLLLLYQLFCHRHLKAIINSVQLIELQVMRGEKTLHSNLGLGTQRFTTFSTALKPSDKYTICSN